MDFSSFLSAWRRKRQAARAAVDDARGYRVSRKQVFFAYVIEAAIIGAGAFAGYQFANRYAGDEPVQVAALDWYSLGTLMQPISNQAWWMAIVATLAMCVAELARVPLAQAFRTQRSIWMKVFAIVGVLCACIVTTKTMSQVMEQMFHPRLRFVQAANAELTTAKAKLDLVLHERGSASDILKPLNDELARIDGNTTETQQSLQAMGPQPKPMCIKIPHRNKKTGKRWTETKCTQPSWPGDELLMQLETLQAQRAAAVAKRDTAQSNTGNAEARVAQAKLVVSQAEDKHQAATAESQLHSFTAMVFGKDPVEVSDAEVHWFLRIFVFVPSIMIALASSLLAMTAYQTLPRRREGDPLEISTLLPALEIYVNDLVDHKVGEQKGAVA